jgi:tetratricopeptide (TPR) repeat protein
MPASRFDFDRVRLEAAQGLPPQCFDDFQRLTRSIVHGPDFQWLLVDAPDDTLRQQVMAALDEVLHAAGLRVNRLPLGRRVPDVPALEERLVANAGRYDVVHVLSARGWFDAASWDAFNVRRERIAATVKVRLVFWLDPAAIELASRAAPDLWAWRAGVYAFLPKPTSMKAPPSPTAEEFVRQEGSILQSAMGDKYRRISEIRTWLSGHPNAPDDLLVAPFDELGQLLFAVGDYDGALAHWHERELPLYRRLNQEKDVAATMGQIADVLQARGELDEALRIRRVEQVPFYERVGDVRSRAVTMSQIADALETRGDLDEALRIRREEVLPVFERAGDARGRAVTLGKIADVLQDRGDFVEALRIRREELLPVFEKVGDLRERTITLGRIADVLQARGDFDEALRIRREEEIPVYERFGDVHSRALTLGKIADVLQARGDHEEALRLRREEELPVYEKIGDARARAVTEWKIAAELWRRGSAEEASALMQRAYSALYSMRMPEARIVAERMRGLGIEPTVD